MFGSGVTNFDLSLAAKFFELGTDKLETLISDQNFRQSKAANDVLPEKLNQIQIFNVGIRLCFYPFGEIISRHQNKLILPQDLRKWPDNVESQLDERPWACDRS